MSKSQSQYNRLSERVKRFIERFPPPEWDIVPEADELRSEEELVKMLYGWREAKRVLAAMKNFDCEALKNGTILS